MGAGNVSLVLTRWSRHLGDRPFRVLVQMALTGMDGADPPLYWGGWALLATAAGVSVPPGCDRCSGCPKCASAQRVTRRAIAGLVSAGAIRPVVRPRKGHNAEYQLLIHAVPEGAPVAPGRGGRTPPHRTANVLQTPDRQRPADTGPPTSTLPDRQRPAEEYKEQHSGTQPGIKMGQATDSPAATCRHGIKIGFLDARRTQPRCGDCRRAQSGSPTKGGSATTTDRAVFDSLIDGMDPAELDLAYNCARTCHRARHPGAWLTAIAESSTAGDVDGFIGSKGLGPSCPTCGEAAVTA
jgi:hypothetical protein